MDAILVINFDMCYMWCNSYSSTWACQPLFARSIRPIETVHAHCATKPTVGLHYAVGGVLKEFLHTYSWEWVGFSNLFNLPLRKI